MQERKVAILGSTGSIGRQALEVIGMHPRELEAYVLVANNSVELLAHQARKFRPEAVVIANEAHYAQLKDLLGDLPIKVWAGREAVEQVLTDSEVDIVLSAIVGFAGLQPTINAIKAGKAIALANKETLVVAGALINDLVREYETPLLPVDSEHSAIFQCLAAGGRQCKIKKLLLTASGGPFRQLPREEMQYITPERALRHPVWNMGKKVTIDSATLINKGFEMIEAQWLFGVKPSQIQIVIHPQSIIHSMVEFEDNSVISQMAQPDMRLPIQYALTYPNRMPSPVAELNFFDVAKLTFESVDEEKYPGLGLVYRAAEKGGNMPCILNAANEVAVAMFLEHKISYTGMIDLIESVMQKATFKAAPTLDDYYSSDREARELASHY